MSILEQIAKVMDCTPSDDDDLVEAVRSLVRERNAAEDKATRQRERAKRAERVVEDVTRERDEARFVAKKLAGWCYVTCPAKYHDTIRTALAYEVEP